MVEWRRRKDSSTSPTTAPSVIGVFNCTNAIQAAILANAETLQGSMNNWSKKTLFFPNGTYVVGGSGGLSGNTRGIIERKSAGSFNGGLRIQGESESGVIIRLADNSVDFQDVTNPRYVIFQSNLQASSTPHNAADGTGLEGYHNYMADLTIDLGASNPGACGVNVMMHNIGAIRRVTVQDAVGHGPLHERGRSGRSSASTSGVKVRVRTTYRASRSRVASMASASARRSTGRAWNT